jgi:RNA polymerase sigma-70 factor (ECF subfamily)
LTGLTGAEVYAAYREKVLAYLTGRVECREDAEDLCEEVFAKIFRSLPQYDAAKASLSTWIFQITRFTLIDYLRTRRPNEPLTEDIAAADDLPNEFIRRETLERLAAALNTLEPEERDIIVLRYYKGQTLTEISRLTDISYGMVRVKHNRALRALRVQLE